MVQDCFSGKWFKPDSVTLEQALLYLVCKKTEEEKQELSQTSKETFLPIFSSFEHYFTHLDKQAKIGSCLFCFS